MPAYNRFQLALPQLQSLDNVSEVDDVPEFEFILVDHPSDGIPHVIDTPAALADAVAALRTAHGPVALDAERASGFRYSARAYLIQLRREGAGTFLIDPTAFDNLNDIQAALDGVEWILHAASQDLICLAMEGLHPTTALYDTELAGRLLGFPRVALSSLTEAELGITLAKEHSAADWSTRPLPAEWLNYAALDVEFLIPLWESLKNKLVAANRYDIALQEFAHVVAATVITDRVDPWRRTSQLHRVKKPAELAIVRELWIHRDQIAQERDVAPGRLLPDAGIVALALGTARTAREISQLPELANRSARRHTQLWVEVLETARALPESEWPPARVKASGPPAVRNWAQKNPTAFEHLEAVRAQLAVIAEEMNIAVEHLITPDVMRRIVWEQPQDESTIERMFNEFLVRQWQREVVMPILRAVLLTAN